MAPIVIPKEECAQCFAMLSEKDTTALARYFQDMEEAVLERIDHFKNMNL